VGIHAAHVNGAPIIGLHLRSLLLPSFRDVGRFLACALWAWAWIKIVYHKAPPVRFSIVAIVIYLVLNEATAFALAGAKERVGRKRLLGLHWRLLLSKLCSSFLQGFAAAFPPQSHEAEAVPTPS
jgi:hypothetical protein